MSSSTLVKKASGEKEAFSGEKLANSLIRAGADKNTVSDILTEIDTWLYDGVSTKKIYKKAFGLLTKYRQGMAARYSLKKAIMELGPTGFPFENFVSQLLEITGYKTEVNQVVKGKCVSHEVDVIATSERKQIFIECKFYNSQGKYANVKVPLYIHSRFKDIEEVRKNLPEYSGFSFRGWLVTNTRFTSDAMDYGRCAGLHLVSWDYPNGESLRDMVEKEGLFPVTTLTNLKKEQKILLLDSGIVLCRQILQKPNILDTLGLKESVKLEVLEEAGNLVGNF